MLPSLLTSIFPSPPNNLTMCIHASWMDSKVCTRCNLPRTGFSVQHIGVEHNRQVKRVSTLPSRFIPKAPDEAPKPTHACVACGEEVNPGFCYRGSVLSDLIHSTLLTSSTTPVLGVMSLEVPGYKKDVVIGGHTIEGRKQIAFRKRTKGLLCQRCASCISRVPAGKPDPITGKVETVPIVDTEPVAGYLAETARGAETDLTKWRRGPAFNTRVTQGRRGKRV